jgi:hypothetical protein
MPYIDSTGVSQGWSDLPQPTLGLTTWVDAAPVLPTPVPSVVSRFQALAALQMQGMLAAVVAIFADPAVDPIQKLAWDNATEFRRDSPTLAALAGKLGMTSAQLDSLFILAASLVA